MEEESGEKKQFNNFCKNLPGDRQIFQFATASYVILYYIKWKEGQT